MKEVYSALRAVKGKAALATVIRVEGSAYRHEGAKLLIPEEGTGIGMLSGGCLEDDVREQSQPAFGDGRPLILTYDMRAEDDGLWGLNLGCNGLVEVFVEPVDPVLQSVADEYQAGRPCTALVVTNESPVQGRRMLLRADGSVAGSLGDPALDREALAAVHGRSRPGVVSLGAHEVFVEPILPPPVLWVVGAGADAIPLVRFAAAAGWRVRVVDRRQKYTDPARFPDADLVEKMEPEQLAERAGIGAFAVFMHHNFDHDHDYLSAMLLTRARYLGVLGPLRRTLKMLETDALPENVYAPVGLDLGGDGPEAVAVSIVAEIQAVLHGREGRHLRGSSAPIHRE